MFKYPFSNCINDFLSNILSVFLFILQTLSFSLNKIMLSNATN